MICKHCGSGDLYIRAWARGWVAIVACYQCGTNRRTRSKDARRLPTTEERQQKQRQTEAAQAAERSRYGN